MLKTLRADALILLPTSGYNRAMRVVAVLFVLMLTAVAQATVTGKIDSIGFASFIRPDCWIPLTIQTSSDEDGPKTFDLQVVQTDLDGDQVVYTKPITVNPGVQSFWTCFKPDPINYGIPASGTAVAPDLAKRLRIFLADPTNPRKRLVQISVAGNLPQAAEEGLLAGPRGQKMILIVGRSPNVNEYRLGAGNGVLGTMEDVLFVRMQAKDLPADALGYDAADAIVWTDEDPERLAADQFRAMRQYIRAGGRLVVIQNAEVQRMGRLDDLLPVHIDAEQSVASFDTLKSILTPQYAPLPLNESKSDSIDPWQRISGPFNIARAAANTDAVIDTWMTWPDGTQTPYIARRLLGVGCVSWIAQDISDPNITAMPFGWPRLWERLMDWRDNDLTFPATLGKSELEKANSQYDPGYSRDIGQAFNQSINLTSTTAALITLAVVFFIGYWCVAGPGSFFVLAARKRTQWSWFVFGGTALAATLLTVAVTKLVLRGNGRAAHLSLVRVSSNGGEPAFVQSRFGIYLPRDENAEITLTERDTAVPAAITPLITWPKENNVTLRDLSRYYIPIEGDDQGATTQIIVPFRSTLKKLQASWAGQSQGRLNGKPTLQNGDVPLSGMLSNNTGKDLKDVIMVFRLPLDEGRSRDYCLALPAWKNGVTIDLAKEWSAASSKPINKDLSMQVAGLEKSQRGPWDWAATWIFSDIRGSSGGLYDDSSRAFSRTFPLASLFDRCTPMKYNSGDTNRCEITRRDVRNWDCSAAVAAGALLVLGQADGSIPLPLTVDGEVPDNTGHTFFQCVVPMDLSHFSQPPSTQPNQN